VSPLTATLIVVVADVITATAMLLLFRRRAPEGGYFQDTQQATGVFTVLGTTFAVLLAFTFFLAFQSYDTARKSAEQEAVATTGLFHMSERFSPAVRNRLTGLLVCYARGVADQEWRTMHDDEESDVVTARIRALNTAFTRVRIGGPEEDAAYAKWLDYAADRAEGRRGRLAEAAPFVPAPVWAVLIIAGLLVTAYTLFFADRRERRVAQILMIGSVTTLVVSSLLLVKILDNPYGTHAGSIQPDAMRNSLALMQGELAGDRIALPGGCPQPARGG
jgi:hypothetical protein